VISGAHPDLEHALRLSQQVVAAADQGELADIGPLDARRLTLLKSFRRASRQPGPADRAALAEIAALNERALGLMEHHRRIKGRAMDLAATGRRAVAAYAATRASRHFS
jgi:hypothetical protein